MTTATRAIAENGVKWVEHQEKDILLPPAEQPWKTVGIVTTTTKLV
jgi:hypothetical protein